MTVAPVETNQKRLSWRYRVPVSSNGLLIPCLVLFLADCGGEAGLKPIPRNWILAPGTILIQTDRVTITEVPIRGAGGKTLSYAGTVKDMAFSCKGGVLDQQSDASLLRDCVVDKLEAEESRR